MKKLLIFCALVISFNVYGQASRWVSNDCSSGPGTGTYTWSNGETYEGECFNERLEGQGTLYLENGDRYVGMWSNDLQNGEGAYFWANGDRYESPSLLGQDSLFVPE